MEWDVNTQVRITPWPDRPVPLPGTVKVQSQLDATETVILPLFTDGVTDAVRPDKQKPVELTGETYLELEQVDLDDPQSILAFVDRYGCLGGWSAYNDLFHEATNRESDPLFFTLYHHALDGDATFAAREKAVREQMTTLPDWIPPNGRRQWRTMTTRRLVHNWFPPVVETLDEFRFVARVLLDLKTAWQVVRDRLNPAEVQWRSDPSWQGPLSPDDELRVAFGEPPSSAVLGNVVQPTYFLPHVLDCFLHWFQPRLHPGGVRFPLPLEDEPTEYPTATIVEPRRKPEHVPLYAICALELFNHIVDNAQYHTCANERCQRTFVHQQGRSEKGQRRSRGVLYCSPACARATAQREYRRRRLSRERETP